MPGPLFGNSFVVTAQSQRQGAQGYPDVALVPLQAYAGREEVKMQTKCNISILNQWRDPRRRNISQLA